MGRLGGTSAAQVAGSVPPLTHGASDLLIPPSDLQKVMRRTWATLLAGGPDNATAQNRLAKEATAFVKDRGRAAVLAEQLAVTISFHHMLAEMNNETVGPCLEAMSILDEIEVASG